MSNIFTHFNTNPQVIAAMIELVNIAKIAEQDGMESDKCLVLLTTKELMARYGDDELFILRRGDILKRNGKYNVRNCNFVYLQMDATSNIQSITTSKSLNVILKDIVGDFLLRLSEDYYMNNEELDEKHGGIDTEARF